jgi:NTE family protein
MKRALVLAGGGARGSFQAGVWKYLTQIGWKPDIICGTSIGAVNAAAIGSGMDTKTLIHLWTTYNRRRMYRLNLLQFAAYLFSKRAIKPLLDTKPLQKVLHDNLDFTALKKSKTKIIITAVNMLTGHPEFFNQSQIQLEHILASSAMPLLFPWQEINGEPYWDGGVMVNTPIAPALDFGADEIIVVLLSPVSHKKLAQPDTVLKAGEHLFEHLLAGSYQANLMNSKVQDNLRPKIITLAPSKMLGFKSLLNFSKAQANQLVEEGYNTAGRDLRNKLFNVKE